MNALFYTAVFLLLLVLQTVAVPVFLYGSGGCDFFLPFVFYLAVFRPLPEGLPAVLCTGLLTDSLSAAPFGLYTGSRLWFFALVKWGLTFLHVRHRMFLPLILSFGILLEDLTILACLRLSGNFHFPFPPVIYTHLTAHLLWNAGAGPFVFIGISFIHRHWQRQIRKLLQEKKK